MLIEHANIRSSWRLRHFSVDSWVLKTFISGIILGVCIPMCGHAEPPRVAAKKVPPWAPLSQSRPTGGEIENTEQVVTANGYTFKSVVYLVDHEVKERFEQRLGSHHGDQRKLFYHVFRIYDNNNNLVKEVWNDMLPINDFKDRIFDEDLWEKELFGGIRFLAFDAVRKIVYCVLTSDDSKTASLEVFEIQLNNITVKHVGNFGSMGANVRLPSLSPDGDALAIVTIRNNIVGQNITLMHLDTNKIEFLPRTSVDYNISDTSLMPFVIKSINWIKNGSVSFQLEKGNKIFTYKYK